MQIDLLLSRLEKLRQTGPDRWIACCPAHNDKTPSMAIKQASDKILIKCFAGCDVESIVNAVDLELTDLFPERITTTYTESGKPIRKPFVPQDVINCLTGEINYLIMLARDMREGEVPTEEDLIKLDIIQKRFATALEVSGT